MSKKELLFSVSIKDCDVQAFKGSGAGGQARNKTSSAIRVVHRASGAVGQASDAREQHINKRTAFQRMAETEKFKTWLKVETARAFGKLPEKTIEEQVEEALHPKHIKVEIKDETGSWIIGDIKKDE